MSGVPLRGGSVVTLVPGVKTGRFLSAKCSVTFSQLRKGWTETDVTTNRPWLLSCTLPCGTAPQAHQEKRGREHPPVLVHVDLLLDQLSVGALCFLLRHRHQLDQFRPETQWHTLSELFCTRKHKTYFFLGFNTSESNLCDAEINTFLYLHCFQYCTTRTILCRHPLLIIIMATYCQHSLLSILCYSVLFLSFLHYSKGKLTSPATWGCSCSCCAGRWPSGLRPHTLWIYWVGWAAGYPIPYLRGRRR